MSQTSTSILTKVAAWVGLLLSLALALGVLMSNHSAPAAPSTGSINGAIVQNAPYAFPNGLYLGSQKNLTLAAVMSIGVGTNQTFWKNTSGQTAYVFTGSAHLNDNGTTTSAVTVSVGTTTCATIADNFSAAQTAPMWSQFIDAFKVATGTQGEVADNIAGHKTAYPGTITVPSGACLAAIVESSCITDGTCHTATSSSRGWTTMGIPIYYHL